MFLVYNANTYCYSKLRRTIWHFRCDMMSIAQKCRYIWDDGMKKLYIILLDYKEYINLVKIKNVRNIYMTHVFLSRISCLIFPSSRLNHIHMRKIIIIGEFKFNRLFKS